MMSSTYAKKKRSNYSSNDVENSITKIQTGEISKAEYVQEYRITRQTLVWICKKKRSYVTEKSPCPIPVMGEAADKYLVQWALIMQKQGLSVGRYMIMQEYYEINCYMFGSMHSVVLVGRWWCDKFMSFYGELNLRTAQVIKWARNKSILEGLRRFYRELCHNIIEWKNKNITVAEKWRDWICS